MAAATVRLGVVGWPVAHSRSPIMFRHWFDRYGIDAIYEAVPVPPQEIDRFFAGLPESGLRGVNVTLPHKGAAARCVEADAVAARLGSVNTIWLDDDGRACGTSSDGAGFVKSLDASAPDWRVGGRAVVLGAGGAAASVADALVSEGQHVLIANRTAAKAQRLAAVVGAQPLAWEDLDGALSGASLLVNATSLGMMGSAPLPVDPAALGPHATVADLVYTPLETPLLAAARACGLATVDGLGMLFFQAQTGFERWFGRTPEVDEALRRAVAATL